MDQQLSAEAEALVPKFRDAAERMRSGRLLEPPEALSLMQQFVDLFPAMKGAALGARLLAHDSFPAALLGLLAAALRLDVRSSPDACSVALNAHNDLCAAASTAAGALVVDSGGDCPLPPEALDFATRLLRTQALQCYSRLLAAATEDVQAAGTGASLRAARIIRGAAFLVIRLADVARRSMADGSSEAGAAPVSGAARQRQQQQQQQQARGLAYAGELAAVLRGSCVAEHLARAALHRHLRLGEAAEATVLEALYACMALFDMHDAYCKAGLSDEPAASSLRGALGGRCVRHLALSSALAALCAADGGPSYGLPAELLLGLPVFDNSSLPADVRQRQGVRELNGVTISLSLSVLELTLRGEPALPPPPGRRAAVALLLRLGRLGVESGRVWAEVDAGSAPGQREESGDGGQCPAGRAPIRPPPGSLGGGGVAGGGSVAVGGSNDIGGGGNGGSSISEGSRGSGGSGGGGGSVGGGDNRRRQQRQQGRALVGRCVRHLALSSALAALCAADGGPSYGLPEELLLRLPVFGNGTSPVDLRQRQGVQELNGMTIRLSLEILGLSLDSEPIPTPPPGRRAAVALLLRLGRLGVESGRVWAEMDAGSAPGEQERWQQRPKRRVVRSRAGRMRSRLSGGS
ncbi:hypothetical protein TSOC_010566 [Tetrabaena socialis]|uniref:Uncharacterized protein n=1 Tax=Tetrabaena socialis TaxID=47790 RepID=A0A2J7ZSV7_9CHLO|nr:hypothetical protein TSOC_010566 [Tetrabaena socialis]|eukprot:PNH03351.1 hypothetical protein TSOC_010566 [Tetrabaena socialis]